jgi:hypothetical protein
MAINEVTTAITIGHAAAARAAASVPIAAIAVSPWLAALAPDAAKIAAIGNKTLDSFIVFHPKI